MSVMPRNYSVRVADKPSDSTPTTPTEPRNREPLPSKPDPVLIRQKEANDQSKPLSKTSDD